MTAKYYRRVTGTRELNEIPSSMINPSHKEPLSPEQVDHCGHGDSMMEYQIGIIPDDLDIWSDRD